MSTCVLVMGAAGNHDDLGIGTVCLLSRRFICIAGKLVMSTILVKPRPSATLATVYLVCMHDGMAAEYAARIYFLHEARPVETAFLARVTPV